MTQIRIQVDNDIPGLIRIAKDQFLKLDRDPTTTSQVLRLALKNMIDLHGEQIDDYERMEATDR
jgi:hypothetical protein